MKHRLPCAAAVVEHRAVTCRKVALPCELCRDKLQLSQHGCIVGRRIRERNQMLARAQQDMAWRLRLNIFKRKNILVLINQFCWDFLVPDLAEQAIVHNQHPVSRFSQLYSVSSVLKVCRFTEKTVTQRAQSKPESTERVIQSLRPMKKSETFFAPVISRQDRSARPAASQTFESRRRS